MKGPTKTAGGRDKKANGTSARDRTPGSQHFRLNIEQSTLNERKELKKSTSARDRTPDSQHFRLNITREKEVLGRICQDQNPPIETVKLKSRRRNPTRNGRSVTRPQSNNTEQNRLPTNPTITINSKPPSAVSVGSRGGDAATLEEGQLMGRPEPIDQGLSAARRPGRCCTHHQSRA